MTTQKLVGTYKITYSHGVDVIVLERNGTFEQTYSPNPTGVVTNSGRWRIYEHDGHRGIELDHLLLVNDFPKDSRLTPPQLTSAGWQLREIGGAVEIVADSDGVFYYQQQRGKQ